MRAGPVAIGADIRDAGHPGFAITVQFTVDDLRHRRALPFTIMSESSASSHNGARYARCVAKPRYSFVIWNSIISGVFGMG